jgi:hypothetical protein
MTRRHPPVAAKLPERARPAASPIFSIEFDVLRGSYENRPWLRILFARSLVVTSRPFMKTIMVRYKTSEAEAETNAALVRAVYEELHAKQLQGVRYATYRLPDGVTFVHLATHDGDSSQLTTLPTFRAFQEQLKQRCVELPVATEVTVVGAHGLPWFEGAAK